LLESAVAQTENWKRYNDPGQRFSFLYPPNWVINDTHNNINGYTQAILTNPNSSRMKVSVIWITCTSTVRVNFLTNIPFKITHLQVIL
jgi:hypothetical protein